MASPRGGSTFYLGGPNPHGGFAFNKTVYALVRAKGPVLLRGGRIDGAGTLKLDGPAADPHEPGETVTSNGGVTRTFFAAVLLPGALQADGSTGDVFYLYPTTPGCYALQADGDGFENIVVLVATPLLGVSWSSDLASNSAHLSSEQGDPEGPGTGAVLVPADDVPIAIPLRAISSAAHLA